MCSRSGGNDNSSSSGDAIAEGTTTVSVSSIPSLTVKSMPSMTITVDNTTATPVAVTSFPTLTLDNSSAIPVTVTSLPVVTLDNSSTLNVTVTNAGLGAISHTMICKSFSYTSDPFILYTGCDASDDTVLSSGSITHDAAFAAGWKLVGPACGTGSTSYNCVLFHK